MSGEAQIELLGDGEWEGRSRGRLAALFAEKMAACMAMEHNWLLQWDLTGRSPSDV